MPADAGLRRAEGLGAARRLEVERPLAELARDPVARAQLQEVHALAEEALRHARGDRVLDRDLQAQIERPALAAQLDLPRAAALRVVFFFDRELVREGQRPLRAEHRQ